MTSADLERLRTKFGSGALTHPAGSVPSLVDVAAAFWTASGAADVGLSDAARGLGERIGTPRHIVLVIADGLGLDLLESMPAASFLWQHLAGEARTVFPSTTAVALTSLHTARWPGEHAVVGHWMLGPRDVGAMTVLSFTRRGDSSDLDAVQTDEVFAAPALLGRGERDALFVLPERIVRGPFSEFSSGAGERVGYRSLADGVDAVLAHVRDSTRPTCTVLYLSRIDDAAHEHGPTHLEVVGEVRALDAEMQRLASELRGEDARIVLTADHGHLPVGQGQSRVLRGDDEVGRYLRMSPTGDARVAYFHLAHGEEFEAFSYAFRERWGEQFVLLTPDEVVVAGLLGEVVTETARARLGDAVAIPLGSDVLEFRPVGGKADPRLTLRSQHSGLTAAEMRVPFIVI